MIRSITSVAIGLFAGAITGPALFLLGLVILFIYAAMHAPWSTNLTFGPWPIVQFTMPANGAFGMRFGLGTLLAVLCISAVVAGLYVVLDSLYRYRRAKLVPGASR
jgi:hypothetical protein